MFKYILKRILFFIPTIIVISLITFIINVNAPGDPVEFMLSGGKSSSDGKLSEKLAGEKAKIRLRHELGLDLPLFYVSLSNLAKCDTLYKLTDKNHRENLARLTYEYGDWASISEYYKAIKQFEYTLLLLPKDSVVAPAYIRVKEYINQLYFVYDDNKIESIFRDLNDVFKLLPHRGKNSGQNQLGREELDFLFKSSPLKHELYFTLKGMFINIVAKYHNMIKNSNSWKKLVPTLHVNGINNQYHNWIFGDKSWYSSLPWVDDSGPINYKSKGFIRGDFGRSYQDKRPVSSVIWDALGWTALINIITIFIAYIVSIPLGVRSAIMKGTNQDQIISTFLFFLYSLPNFWIATMLIMFLGGGDFLDWFPSHGTNDLDASDPFIDRFFDIAYHLVLPLFCLVYPSFAFLSRQARGGMLNVLNQDYIRTAKAKGLSNKKVIWKHTFRNALIPIITLLGSILPFVITGSVVIEYIFSIPGMGSLLLDATKAKDYPIVYTIVMFASILTLFGFLLSDILYAVVDPRISYGNKK